MIRKLVALLFFLAALCFILLPVAHGAQPNTTGWKPDPKGTLYAYYHVQAEFAATVLQDEVDLRPKLPAAWDQGQLGACTAYGSLAAYWVAWLATNSAPPPLPSFLGFYYDERAHDGTQKQDAGSYISTGAWVAQNVGVGTATTWPYTITKFQQQPPPAYYKEAKNYLLLSGVKIDSGTSKARHLGIITALSNGRCVVFGGYVYNSIFNTGKDGFEAIPGGSLAGGHCRCIVGVSMKMTHRYSPFGKTYKGFYIVRNSWSPTWGDKGYSYIPVEVIENLKINDDFWTYIETSKVVKPKKAKSKAVMATAVLVP